MHKHLDVRLRLAVRELDLDCVADVWRALRPVANAFGLRAPSYSATVRLVQAERARRAALEAAKRAQEDVVATCLAGGTPTFSQLVRLEAAWHVVESA